MILRYFRKPVKKDEPVLAIDNDLSAYSDNEIDKAAIKVLVKEGVFLLCASVAELRDIEASEFEDAQARIDRWKVWIKRLNDQRARDAYAKWLRTAQTELNEAIEGTRSHKRRNDKNATAAAAEAKKQPLKLSPRYSSNQKGCDMKNHRFYIAIALLLVLGNHAAEKLVDYQTEPSGYTRQEVAALNALIGRVTKPHKKAMTGEERAKALTELFGG